MHKGLKCTFLITLYVLSTNTICNFIQNEPPITENIDGIGLGDKDIGTNFLQLLKIRTNIIDIDVLQRVTKPFLQL